MVWAYSGSERLVLASHGRGGPSSFAPQSIRSKAIVPLVNSRYPSIENRGNTQRVWSFTSSREHASESAAQSYLINLAATVPEKTTVYIELSGYGKCYRLTDCLIDFSPRQLMGVRTKVTWTLTWKAKAALSTWVSGYGYPIWFDGLGYVNASGGVVDGHTKPELNTEWSWPAAPTTGDYVFSDLLGYPAWYDGVGWINATGGAVDGHTKPAANGSYTRPADPAEGDMELDEALWIPIWRLNETWINATGAEV